MLYVIFLFILQGAITTETTEEVNQNIYHAPRVVATKTDDGKIIISSIENMKTEKIKISAEPRPDIQCNEGGCSFVRQGFHPDDKMNLVY